MTMRTLSTGSVLSNGMPRWNRLCVMLSAVGLLGLTGCGAALNWDSSARGNDGGGFYKQSTPQTKVSNRKPPRQRLASAEARPASYRVKSGDTLYSIAYLHRIDYRDLAAWNGRQGHYRIFDGETLTLQPKLATTSVAKRPNVNSSSRQNLPKGRKAYKQPSLGQPPQKANSVVWQWPTAGAVVAFDATQQGRLKGLLIKGKFGQSIHAAAAGQVVYAGNGLPSYGRLIIIQHSTNYFSAYAYNQKLYVKQGEAVSAGQSIAAMGKVPGEKDSALRFDIRVGTESIDPAKLLPKKA